MSDVEAVLAAVFAIVVVILLWHAITRDKEVRRTRWGVFIERDRYDGTIDDTVWPQPPTGDEDTTEKKWPVP